MKKYSFPENAYLEAPKTDRRYDRIGLVRTKVEFSTLNPEWDEARLCKNYFNKAAQDLVKRAKSNGGDAVIEVKSVVFLMDGRQETYSAAECSDDGSEGQILAQGVVIRWVPEERD